MQKWIQQVQKTLTPNYRPAPIVFERGEGNYLYTPDQTPYLDFTAGIAVCALGHHHPDLSRAVAEQAHTLIHISNLFINQPALELSQKLTDLCFGDQVYFGNSGAESNEAALKMARRYMSLVRKEPQRYKIICALKSFHGRTWAAISATGQPKYHEGFAPLVPGFVHVPYNDLQAMKDAVDQETCAILIEPLQGEGGVVEAQEGYLKGLREMCDQEGILLIFDEVQTGVGRTGNWFAHQHDGVEPDIMSLAKGLGGGVPIGAVVCTQEAGKGFAPGAHASTFGGNPLACRAALTVLDVIEKQGLVEHAQEMGNYLASCFDQLQTQHPLILKHRGRGLLRGLVVDPQIDRSALVNLARDHQLLITRAGADTLRVCPPLIIGPAHVDEAIEKLDLTFTDFEKTL